MLVITRYSGQKFFIGKDITVCILKQHNGAVHVGINAPKEIKILRSELIKGEQSPFKQWTF